jgi:hypothetical protein
MVGGAKLPPEIQKERESWFLMKRKPYNRANDGSFAMRASAPSFALDTAVVVIDGMTIFKFFKLYRHRTLP